MIQLLQVEFGKGMKFGAVFAATFVAELKKSSFFFFVCVTALLRPARTGSKICSALYHSTTKECMCMWDEKKSKKYTNKHIHLYI